MSHLHPVICLKMTFYKPHFICFCALVRGTHNCFSKQNQSVVKLFLNTDLENEIEGSKLVAN